MVKLLEQSMPLAPSEYDSVTFVRILRDLEMALTKIEFPEQITSQDDNNSLTWFME
tara:strand:- start:1136 stop:1303 length:168 start_codon:yes stop_codon:yes gene_type:complete